MEDLFTFLNELRENNNREWFEANKARYLDIKQYITTATQNLINSIAAFDPAASMLTPSDCTYRIYRDTRFSTDKTPYKTHVGIFINPPFGKKSLRLGYYLHLEPGTSEIGAGNVCLPSRLITDIRKAVYDNIDEYLSIIKQPEFERLFPVVGMNPVKTAPKGFPRDWEHIDLIRPRDFYVSHRLSDKEVLSKSFLKKAADIFKTAKPYCDFHNYTIDLFKE